MLDLNHPFFRPLWLRIAVVAVCLGWAAIEFGDGSPFWGVIFAGIGVYAGWQFFFAFDPGRSHENSEGDKA